MSSTRAVANATALHRLLPRHISSGKILVATPASSFSSSSLSRTFPSLTSRRINTCAAHGTPFSTSTSTLTYESRWVRPWSLTCKFSTASASDGSTSNQEEEEEMESGPRLIPTRHSRHHFPPVAPMEVLDDLTKSVLDTVPGTLFSYSPGDANLDTAEEYESALVKSDEMRQKVEFLIRGYSALIPGTLVDLQSGNGSGFDSDSGRKDYGFGSKHVPDPDTQPDKYQAWIEERNDESKYQEKVDTMIQLLERIELEGKVYVELRSKLRSQLAPTTPSDSSDSSDSSSSSDSDSDYDSDGNTETTTPAERQAWQTQQLIQTFGAPPGPSSAMYDLTLDAIATILPQTPTSHAITLLHTAQTLHSRAVQRHNLDSQCKRTNPHSDPTPLTFNAIIRAAARSPDPSNLQLRDTVIDAAFSVYDAMHHDNVVYRNSATYAYMLEVVAKFLPPSPSRGNVAHGLFYKGTVEEGVLDQGMLSVLQEEFDGGENTKESKEFQEWREHVLKSWKDNEDENGFGFPLKWSRNRRARRYHKNLTVY